ncbi:MAG: hypothetical protein ACRCVT_10770 [Leadbetterella sp.]
MNSTNSNSPIGQNQLETQEFFRSLIQYIKFISSKWQILFIALLIGTCFDLITKSVFEDEKKYSGQLTFHADLGGKGGGGGALMGLASSMGLGAPSVGGDDLLGYSNFMSIVGSLSVYQTAFMKEVKLGNRKDLFINIYIDSSNIKRKEWGPTFYSPASYYGEYNFKKKDPKDFTAEENLIIADVYNKLFEDTRVEQKEKSSLFYIHGSTTNEQLTKLWIELIYSVSEEFYKNMKISKTVVMLKHQENRLDSLSYILKNKDSRLARVAFDNPNVVDPAGKMKEQQLNRDISFISNQYYTQQANVEALYRMMNEQTPIFTLLEPVRLPLTQYEKTGISIRISGLICFAVALLVLSLWRTYLKFNESPAN